MIARSATKRFLKRSLRDSGKLKRWSEAKVEEVYQSLHPPKMRYPLKTHQKVAFILGARHSHYLLFLDPGLGKSLVTLALYRYARRQRKDHKPRMLVLVPNTSNIEQWKDEIRKHCPKLTAGGVDGVGEVERWGQLHGEVDIVIITYMGFLSLVCDEVEKIKKTDAAWVLNRSKLGKVAKRFKFICPDECTAFRNSESLTAVACRNLIKVADHAYGLTGTPFGGDPQDLWSEFHVIDRGGTLGETLGLFRSAFCTAKKDYWSGYDKFTFDKRKKKLLGRMIRHNSIRYEENECLDLPERIEIERAVIFPEETWKYYDRLVEELKAAKSSFKVIDAPFVRMRYLTAGHLSVKGPEGTKTQIKFKSNPKLEALLADLEEIDPKRKVVIFYEYNASGDILCEELKKLKIKHVRLWSKARQKGKLVNQFLTDKKTRVMVSSSAGAYGGNWQVANFVLFFEYPSSPLLLKQETKRCHRMGQKRRVTIFYYQVKGSIDQKIRKAHREGYDLFAALVDGKISADKLARR